MFSRRVALLLAAAGMAVMVLAFAGTAWAEGGGTGPGGFGGAPTVVRTVPDDGATGVDPTANIKAKFSEAMKERTINTNTFYLVVGGCQFSCGDPTRIPATVRYHGDTKTAILDPSAPLLPNTEYTATVEGTGDGDKVAVKDRGGTPLANDKIWSFTTGSCPAC